MLLFFNMSRQAMGHARPSIPVTGFFPGKKAAAASSYFHEVPRLRMTGAIPLFPLYVFFVDRENSKITHVHFSKSLPPQQ
jgi:hypothetical protein